MATAPNQRKVIVHREKCERDFLQIKKENWFAANKDLEPYGLQVYLYLAGNMNGYNLEFSPKAIHEEMGLPESTCRDQFKVLVQKGYLVPKHEDSNIFDFYERPKKNS